MKESFLINFFVEISHCIKNKNSYTYQKVYKGVILHFNMESKLIKQMQETDKKLDDKEGFICRCKDLKNGKAIYCYRHSKGVTN